MGPCGARAAAEKGPQADRDSYSVQTRSSLTAERLPRGWRLSQGSALTAVLRVGRRRRTPRLDVVWYPNDTGHPRLGVIVARVGGSAVRRNQLRRRIREIARRRILHRLAAVDVVIKSRAAAYEADVDTLARDLEQWLSSL